MADEWLKVADVAAYLGVRRRTIYALIDRGELRAEGRSTTAIRADGTLRQRRADTRVRRADLIAYVKAARVRPGDLRHLGRA